MTTTMTQQPAPKNWVSSIREMLSATRTARQEMLQKTVAMVEATVPAYRIATLDHVTRARRISLASLVAVCRKAYAPAPDHAQLRKLLETHSHHVENVTAGLHQLKGRVREYPGWRLNPPVTGDMALLRNMSNDSNTQSFIRAELGVFNPVSMLTIAFEDLAAEGEKFGGMTLEADAEEVTAANSAVAEVLEALRSEPEALADAASHFGITRPGADLAREVLAAAAAVTNGGRSVGR